MEEKEKRSLMVGANYEPSVWVLRAASQEDLWISGLKHVQMERGQTVGIWWIFLVCSLNVSDEGTGCTSLSGPCSNRHKGDCLNQLLWWFLWSLYQVIHILFAGVQEKAFILPSKDGRKSEILAWRVVARYLRELKVLKMQSTLQANTKSSKTRNSPRI